jgi:hypothetical protein
MATKRRRRRKKPGADSFLGGAEAVRLSPNEIPDLLSVAESDGRKEPQKAQKSGADSVLTGAEAVRLSLNDVPNPRNADAFRSGIRIFLRN